MKISKHSIRFSIVAAVATICLSACGNNVLDYRNMQISGGKIYEQGDNTPFTGRLTNFPSDEAFVGTPALDTVRQLAAKYNKLTYNTAASWFRNVCDVAVKNGYRDGVTTCTRPDTGAQYYEISFKEGELDGDITIYSNNGGRKPTATATIRNGKIDGDLKIYSVANGKLIGKVRYETGIFSSEEDFDADTGKTTFSSHSDDQGLTEGKVLQYSPDGQLIGYSQYSHGKPIGETYQFYPDTGKIKKCTDPDSPLTPVGWDESGNIVDNVKTDMVDPATLIYKRPIPQSAIDACLSNIPAGTPGVDALAKLSAAGADTDGGVNATATTPVAPASSSTAAAQQAPASDSCVDSWTVAYRKEQGEDAIVSYDQIGEWQGWCKEGKKPAD